LALIYFQKLESVADNFVIAYFYNWLSAMGCCFMVVCSFVNNRCLACSF